MMLTEREGSTSGLLLSFVNKVTKLINIKHPKVKVSTLAYLTAYMPPRNIKPAPNVVIFLATDRHIWKNPFHYVDETQKFQTALAGWNKIAKEIHLWDYVFGDNSNWMNPAPNFDVIAHNLSFYLKYNAVTGIFFQDNYISIGDSRAAMKNWILTKLMWNPAWDVKKLEQDFTLGYYGAAGPAMQEYNDLLRSEWGAYHDNNPPDSKKFMISSNFLPTAQHLISKAKQTVTDNEIYF